MGPLLRAAFGEREFLLMENESLADIVKDMSQPEEARAGAEIRLIANESTLDMIDGIICMHLERLPIEEVLTDINTNLSSECN